MSTFLEKLGTELFERVYNYAQGIISGETIACKKHIWASERFARDLKNENYYFDKDELARFYLWSSQFKHRAGVLKNKKIELTDFQLFVVGNIFCFKWKSSGLRRFRKVYIQLARKNAKTQLLALITSYEEFCSDEQSECYLAGWDKEQSSILYREIMFQLDTCDKLKGKYKTSYGKITSILDGSFIKPLSREARTTGDGTNPSIGICDEYHAHKTSEIYDVILSGMVAREQPLMIIITTAGFNLQGPCYKEYKLVSKILDPNLEAYQNEEYFIMICELDEDDDISDESCWPKANPIVCTYEGGWKYLRGELVSAQQDATKMRNFLTKNMNRWVNMRDSGYMNMEKWNNAEEVFTLEKFRGMDCTLGVDLSTKIDLTSICFEFCVDGTYYVYQHSFMPEERFNARLQEAMFPFDLWLEQGFLTVCEGATISYYDVINYIKDIESKFGIHIMEICYDPYNASFFVETMQLDGYICVEIRQGPYTLNEPTKDFRDKVYEGTLKHTDDGLFTWSMGNAIATTKSAEYTMLDKGKSEEKIDPCAAAMNAHCRAIKILDSYNDFDWCPTMPSRSNI